MKITKQGVSPSEREWKAACRVCNTEFEFLEREGLTTPQSDRDGSYILVYCPVCHAQCFGGLK